MELVEHLQRLTFPIQILSEVNMKQVLAAISLMLVLCACSAPVIQDTPVPAAATQVPAATPTLTPAVELLTYTDQAAGFSFDYPKDWMLESGTFGARAAGVQLTSWTHPAGQISDETPPGGSRLDVLVQLWDPKGDLPAFSQQRTSAWEASGITVISEADLTLSGARAARQFVVQGADGAQGYFLFTTLGEDYLVFSGNGDLALLGQIARSLR
jgi:hypothetical protein